MDNQYFKSVRINFNSSLSSLIVFIPGIMLLSMAVLVFVAPSLVLALAAGLFLYLGALMCLIGYKVLQLKKRFGEVAKQFGSRIEFRTVASPRTDFQEAEFQERPNTESVDVKKIILH